MYHDLFTAPLLNWYHQNGRHDLPWQHPKDAYRVWLSEIMLQQTQVKTVIPYFNRFIDRFPTVHDLAEASIDEVLTLWAGLGYYSRARNLHRAAEMIVRDFHSEFPRSMDALTTLPGIGQTTAAAILSLAYNLPYAIMDGNVKRVLSRFFAFSHPNKKDYESHLWALARSCQSQQEPGHYTQAIMDLGALCCTPKSPQCNLCPVQQHCKAYRHQSVGDFPPKFAKKPLPTVHKQFLIIENQDGAFLLYKRPLKGLWGGLWSLPELPMTECPKACLGTKDSPITFPSFTHTFSHYHLEIHPVYLKVNGNLQITGFETEYQWIAEDKLMHYGLPKPITTLLRLPSSLGPHER